MAEDCKYQVKRANLHYVREQISKFLCDLDTRVVTLEQSISGGTRFTYKWNDTLTGDPTSGYVAADTNDPDTVTEIRISDFTVEGTDASEFISELQADDLVALYEGVEPNSAAVFTVLGIPVDNGTYFTIPVTVFPATGTALPALKDNPVDVHLLERRQHKLYDEHIHTDVDSSTPLEQRHILGWNALDKWAADFRMNWRGNWLNQEYQKHDVVLDAPYTMIANKPTTDRAAPVPIGNPEWDNPDDNPPWLNLSQVAVVGTGHTYTFSETVQANSLRVWIPTVTEDYTYRLTTIREGQITSRELTTLSAGQWNVVAYDPILLLEGSQFIAYLEALNSGGTTVVSGGWIRGVNDNAAEPANQHWNMNVQRTVLRIDFDDLDAVSRQTELEGIIVGSTIQFAETALPAQNSITFQVVNPPVTGVTSVIYDVVVISEGVNLPTIGEPATMTADVPVPQATDYVGILGGWLGNQPLWGTVESYLAFDGVEQIVSPDNQYGLSLNVQRINISEDWDVVAISGNSGSGGGADPAELQGYLGEAFPTGLYDGGELNVVNGGLNVEIIAGAGVVVNSYDKPTEVPTKVNLSWDTQDQPITTPATAGAIAWITMADSGTTGVLPNTNLGVLTERSTQPTPAQERDEVFIGFLIYNGTSWGEVSTPTVVNSTAHSFNEYVKSVDSLTHIDSGGEITEAPLFKLDQAAGVIWELNRNWHVNRKDPNREPFDARPAFQWRYVNRDISYVSALTDTVDPTNWDDGTPSTVVPVGGAAVTTTIQRLYLDPRDNYWVLYGQVKHDNFFEALANLGWDETQTQVPFLLSGSLFLGYIVTQRSETDWTEEQAEFITAVRALTGGASAPVTTYDDLTDTPSNKLGAAGKFPKVNVAETAHEYEFIEWSDIQNPPAGAGVWGVSGDQIYNLNTGNVAIGASVAGRRLAVVGTQQVVATFQSSSTAGQVSFKDVNTTSDAHVRAGAIGDDFTIFAGSEERVRVLSAGNVGIGVTVPTGKLEVLATTEGASVFVSRNAGQGIKMWGDGTANYIRSFSGSSKALIISEDSGAGLIKFENPASSERMVITSEGRVGIGTPSPSTTLHLVGGTEILRLRGETADAQAYMSFAGSDNANASLIGKVSTNDFLYYRAISGHLWQAGGSTERMRLTQDGDLAIGATSVPSNLRLQVTKGDASSTGIRVTNSESVVSLDLLAAGSTYSGVGLWENAAILESSDGANVAISAYNGGDIKFGTSVRTERMRIFSTGQLSFGTASKIGKFYVSGCTAEGTAGAFARTTTQGIKYWGVGGGNTWQSFGATTWNQDNIAPNGVIRWRGEGNVERMRLQLATGDLRIGFTSGSGLANEKIRVNGNVNLGSGFNYYINGIPISTFIDAPADGNLYARKDNAWSSIGQGAGTVSDLASSPTTTQTTITNTGGDNAIILGATASRAGVMTTTQVSKLAAIEDDANNYVHPTHSGDDIAINTTNLTGATVIDDIVVTMNSDGEGHVTSAAGSIGTREMTADDLNAYTKPEVDVLLDDYTKVPITGGVETLSIPGTNATGTVIRTTIGNLVMLTGRLSWTSNTGSSSTQATVTGLTYACTYGTGVAVSQNNMRNNNSQRNGISMTIEGGDSFFRLWRMQGEDPRFTLAQDKLFAPGSLDINIMYYSSEVPQ